MPIIHIQFGEIEQVIMEGINRFSVFIILIILCFVGQKVTYGHPMPNSIVVLKKQASKITGEARIPLPDLQLMFRDSIIYDKKAMRDYLYEHILAKNLDGKPWKIIIGKIQFHASKDEMVGEYIEMGFEFELFPPNGEIPEYCVFDYDVVCHQVITHKIDIYLSEYGLKPRADKLKFLGRVELDTLTEKIKFPILKLEEWSIFQRIGKIILNNLLIFLAIISFCGGVFFIYKFRK